jgi:exodeoxyribonuclease VII small subunit
MRHARLSRVVVMTDPAATLSADLSFEDALARLETIVSRLESGQAPLEESITLYEEGARLKSHCEARLKAAQLRVEKIVVGSDGTARGIEPAEFG